MVVAVENELEYLKDTLESKGHQVVPVYGYEGGVDAVLYQSLSFADWLLTTENNSAEDNGVLLVCVKNMTETQILHALEKKCYGEKGILEF